MIDEKKLIEDISNEWGKLVEYSENYETLLEYVVKFIKSQPKIGGWIPCSERLPEEDKDVLIYSVYDGADMAFISDGNWRHTRDDEFIGTVENAGILAWQPLSEAYHE